MEGSGESDDKKFWNLTWKSKQELRAELSRMAKSWVVPVVSFVAALTIAVLLLTSNDGRLVLVIFSGLRENLPLTLPILSVLLSIMLNVRDILRPHGWLKLALPLSLGLVSFSIWYVVAAQSTTDEYLRIGQTKVLNREYAVLLLVIAFIWAGFVAIGRVLGEIVSDENRGWKWYSAQSVVFMISCLGLFVPFLLFETKSDVEKHLNHSLDESSFYVSIPFRDPSLDQHLGRITDPITQSMVITVTAQTESEALAKAKKEFSKSDRSTQFYSKVKDPEALRKVEIIDGMIVTQRQSSRPK